MFGFLNNDENLNQGQLLIDRIKRQLLKSKSNIEGLTTSSNAPSGTSRSKTVISSEKVDNKSSDKHMSVKALEDEFNNTLVQYTTTYKTLMNELLSNINKPELKKYAGKNVMYNNNIYYVNNYGVKHGYTNEAWTAKPSSCSSTYIDISENDFNDLIPGANMGIGQECGIAGLNVEDETTKERAWIDIKDIKHKYSDDVWNNRSQSCQGAPKSLSSSAYLNIPEDSSNPSITSDFYCNKLNADPTLLKNLASLNERLLSLAKQLLKDTEKLSTSDAKLKSQLKSLGKKANKLMYNLEEDRKKFKDTLYYSNNESLSDDAYNSNVSGIKQSSDYKLSSNYLQYIIWLIIAIVLILYASYAFSAESVSLTSTIIVLLVAFVLLYYLATYIKDKLF